jgi:hypothetical protein
LARARSDFYKLFAFIEMDCCSILQERGRRIAL